MSYRRDASASTQATRVASPTPKAQARAPKHLLLREDYRARLPSWTSRFLGYRDPGSVPPYEPLPFPPFTWLRLIPLKYEVSIFGFIGSFVSILLVEAISSTHTTFRDVYRSPLVITSFGAAAVLAYAVAQSPLAQPRNLVLGNFVGAIIGTALTRLFVRNKGYEGYLDNTEFHAPTFVNGALTVSVTILVTLLLGVVHPPAGATALAAATDTEIIKMSWNYIPVVLASSLLVLAWALVINNLGRRRYPLYWWSPHRTFVIEEAVRPDESELTAMRKLEEGPLRVAEDGGRTEEALLEDRMEGRGGRWENVFGPNGRPMRSVTEPPVKIMSRGDRRMAEGV